MKRIRQRVNIPKLLCCLHLHLQPVAWLSFEHCFKSRLSFLLENGAKVRVVFNMTKCLHDFFENFFVMYFWLVTVL